MAPESTPTQPPGTSPVLSGDRGIYEIVSRDAAGTERREERRFAWSGPEPFIDAGGSARWVYVLSWSTFDSPDSEPRALAEERLLINPESFQAVARESQGGLPGTTKGTGRLLRYELGHADRLLPCVARTQIGPADPAGHTWQIWNACDGLPLRQPFRLVGVESMAGFRAWALEATTGPGVRVWLTDSFPYPLRLVVETAQGAHVDWRLVALGRGTGPLESRPTGPGTALNPIQHGPAASMPVGDASLAFPLSKALERARSHTSAAALRSFLERHPTAFVAAAQSHAGFDGAFVVRSWKVELVGGDERLPFAVHESRHELPGDAASNLAVSETPMYSVEMRPGRHDIQDGRLAERVQTLPTLGWILARIREEGPQFAHADTEVSIEVRCDGEGCAKTLARFQFMSGPQARPVSGGHEPWAWMELEPGSPVRSVFAVGAWLPPSPGSPAVFPPDSEQTDTAASYAAQFRHEQEPPASMLFRAGALVALLGTVVGFAFLLRDLLSNSGWIRNHTRLAKHRVLEHAARARLLDLVRSHPGIHREEIQRRLGYARGHADHHLRVLQDFGFLFSSKAAGLKCYFAPGAADRQTMGAAPFLGSRGVRTLLLHFQAGGATPSDAARAVGLSPQTVDYHLARLARGGLVEMTRHGRRRHVRLTAAGVQALSFLRGKTFERGIGTPVGTG